MQRKFLLAGLVAGFVALIAFGVVGYYFYASDCCISPNCTECLLEGEIPCMCGQYLQEGYYEEICNECHSGFCGLAEDKGGTCP